MLGLLVYGSLGDVVGAWLHLTNTKSPTNTRSLQAIRNKGLPCADLCFDAVFDYLAYEYASAAASIA